MAGGGVDEVKVNFAIGTIQTDDQVVEVVGIKHMILVVERLILRHPQA